MPRRARVAPGDCIYHVLNRANGRDILFENPACYRDFLRLVAECAEIDGMRILAYCAMPNHWHFLLWPRQNGDLARFMRRLSIRHAQRRHARNRTVGRGHIYQARFKSHVVQTEAYLLAACRYIERNPVRAGLAGFASEWPWSSAIDHIDESRGFGAAGNRRSRPIELEPFPIRLPEVWAERLGEPETEEQLERIRSSAGSGTPLGDEQWRKRMTAQHGFPGEPRPAGRRRESRCAGHQSQAPPDRGQSERAPERQPTRAGKTIGIRPRLRAGS